MSTFDIFNWRESLISSKVFCAVKASDIKVLTNPFDFACAILVLLSPVNSETVSMSVSQSSSCEESCPFNHTDLYLQWDSHHNLTSKYSVIGTLQHRAQTICSNPQLLQKEEQHLKNALMNCKYPHGLSAEYR